MPNNTPLVNIKSICSLHHLGLNMAPVINLFSLSLGVLKGFDLLSRIQGTNATFRQ